MTGIVKTGILSIMVCAAFNLGSLAQAAGTDSFPAFKQGAFEGWRIEGENTWQICPAKGFMGNTAELDFNIANSLVAGGEAKIGKLTSNPFTITKTIQKFYLAGADGTAAGVSGGDNNFLLLRSYPDGEILRKAAAPGTPILMERQWNTQDLIGREVYLELVDNNPQLNAGGFAWIAMGGYQQQDPLWLKNPVQVKNLSGLKIDGSAAFVTCRTMPFWSAMPQNRMTTTRVYGNGAETIPVNASAETVYLLGMINHGWDVGVAHWGEHPELWDVREDQVQIGSKIGEIEINYAGGKSDRIPIVIGATAWFVAQWAYGPSHLVSQEIKEPFASRPQYNQVLLNTLKLKEDPRGITNETTSSHYYLAIQPRQEKIESIVVYDNPSLRGSPLISAVTLKGAQPADHLHPFGLQMVDKDDLPAAFPAAKPGDWSKQLNALADVLYTKESDLPKKVELIDFPKGFDAAKITFKGGRFADMLSNIWVANLMQIDEKFEPDTGFFHETGKECPWYGGYSGIGTWTPIGVYYTGAFGRCSDHYATLALRCINNSQRLTSYVDFCDKYLYFYRNNHDPNQGPPNAHLDITRWPADAPPHWGFVINGPCGPPVQINELQGDEEMDGHGATIVGRWVAWRALGAPQGDWLTAPRKDIYGKSRYDATKDAANFICWLMEYTGRDVIYCEGEVTGWGAGGSLYNLGWSEEKDPKKILKNYADADMYEPYPSYVCMTGLRCSAQMAEAAGDTASAAKWRAYADRIQTAMIRLLATGDYKNRMWRQSSHSVLPSLQDSLVQAWFAFYYDGLDPQRLHPEMTAISRNTLKRQLSYPYGHKPVLAMGYGMGWITKAALTLDAMDDAGQLLVNIAKYSYDKNMDYVDQSRGINWRKFLWLIPEGANVMPDGRWYRIGDLTNGANQGPAMHALEICAGIDDTKPQDLKILPRVPDPLTGIEVRDFMVLTPDIKGLKKARVSYTYDRTARSFVLASDTVLPSLAVRVGPFEESQAKQYAETIQRPERSTVRIEASGTHQGKPAWWLWVEAMRDIDKVSLKF